MENKSDAGVKKLFQPLHKIFESHSAIITALRKPPDLFRAVYKTMSLKKFNYRLIIKKKNQISLLKIILLKNLLKEA